MSKEKEKQNKKALWVDEETHTTAKIEAAKRRMSIGDFIAWLLRGGKKEQD
jgi:predicted HicB family RNase H-like nuclease